jgi:hypothetical protein
MMTVFTAMVGWGAAAAGVQCAEAVCTHTGNARRGRGGWAAGKEVPLLCFGLEDDEELLALPTDVGDLAAVQAEHATQLRVAPSIPPTADDSSEVAPTDQSGAPVTYTWLAPYRERAAASPSGELQRMETVDSMSRREEGGAGGAGPLLTLTPRGRPRRHDARCGRG